MLDNRVGRPLLGRLATTKARHLLGRDVEIGFDDVWHHRVGSYFVPDRPQFDYYEPMILAWSDEIPAYFRDAKDLWFCRYNPKPGDVVVDVGAGRGEDVLPFATEVGSAGKVVAIEAHPKTYNHLKRFCELNRLRNVVPIHAAVIDSPGMVQIDDGELWEANTVHGAGEGIQVRATTLDSICKEQQLDRIDFLKMNIEGAETRALLGITESVARIRNICVCCHDFRANRGHGEEYRTRSFVIEFLTSFGFSVSHRASDPRDYVRDHLFGIRASGYHSEQ